MKGIYLYIYIYAEDLIWWAIFRLQEIKKQRERRKTKAEKGKQKKEEETWRHENPHLFGGFYSWPISTMKLEKIEIFLPKSAHQLGSPLYVYMCVYIYGCIYTCICFCICFCRDQWVPTCCLLILADFSDIFYFFLLGGGEGGVRGNREGGWVSLKIPRSGGGGGFPGEGGVRGGRDGVRKGFGGVGGWIFLLGGRNARQVIESEKD